MDSLDEEFSLDNDIINLRKQNTVDDASYFQTKTPPYMISPDTSTVIDQEASETSNIGPWHSPQLNTN